MRLQSKKVDLYFKQATPPKIRPFVLHDFWLARAFSISEGVRQNATIVATHKNLM
jgi:hypothetical protein